MHCKHTEILSTGAQRLLMFVWTPLLVQHIGKVIRSTEGQINANENLLDITKANIIMSIATV